MRTIRRYESRKLYDTEASCYISLEQIATRIREGEEIEVVDNVSGETVTSQTLAQIILDEGRSGRGRLSSEFFHDLVRVSGERISSGVDQVQRTAHRLMRASLERLAPIREARDEIVRLQERLDKLESALPKMQGSPPRAEKKVGDAATPRRASGGRKSQPS